MKEFLKHPLRYFIYDMKLQKKLLITHLLVLLIPTLIMSFLLYQQLSHILISMSVHSEQELSRQTADRLESTIASIHATLDSIAVNANLQRFLLEEGKNTAFNQNSLLTFLTTANSYIDGATITDIKVYLDDDFSIFDTHAYDSYDIFHPQSEIKGSYWYGIFASTNTRTLVCPPLYLTPSEAANHGELAIIRKLPFAEGTRNAYVALYFSKSNVDSILKTDISYTNSASYLINSRSTPVSSSNHQLIGTYLLDYSAIPMLIPDTTQFVTLTFAGERAYVGYKEIRGTDWYMVSVIPADNVLTDARDLIYQFFTTYFIFVILAFIIAIYLSKSIVKRIATVIRQMSAVKYGTPKPLVLKPSHDEIGELAETYNYMSDELNLLIEKQKKAASDMRISEFKALQAQINPHFLYNTLDMINWLSQSGKREEVSTAIQALSKFYKLTLNKGNTTVRLEDELIHVSLYVKLQNMRYNDKINFIVDIQDELLDYEMPKLILQPIVENSIQHGIFGKESKEGTIVITGWLEQEDLIFIVSDDGVGITGDKLDSILSGNGDSNTGSNIGIYNTHKRLQLFYDTQFGLSYQSTPGIGTEVTIRIPARLSESV